MNKVVDERLNEMDEKISENIWFNRKEFMSECINEWTDGYVRKLVAYTCNQTSPLAFEKIGPEKIPGGVISCVAY